MGNVRMRAEQINYGASNVKVALDDLDPMDLIALSERMDAIEAWKATVKAEEKTGAEVTFTNALALNAVSLSAEIEAEQDLHGYDKPWVGGAGKNKFPNNTNPDGNSSSITVEKLANGYKLTATNTAQYQSCYWVIADASVYAGKNIFFNALGTYTGGTHLSRVRLEYDDAGGTQVTAAAGDLGTGCALTIPADATGTIKAQLYLSYGQDCAVGDATTFYNIQFEEASSPTAYEPWENICPISGRTAVTVDDVGKNIYSQTNEQGVIYGDGTEATVQNRCRTSGYISIDGNSQYTLKTYNSNAVYPLMALFYDADKNYIGYTTPSSSGYVYSFTSLFNAKFVRFDFTKNNANFTPSEIGNCQLEYGDTATPYVPYAHSSATIQLGQTVYGGTLNVTTGVLTVTHANIASYNGETIGEPWISSMDEYTEGGTPTTGAQVVYPLATPQTIQLTPTDLQMLKGYNRLSCDGGGDITVEAYTGSAWGGDTI